MNDITARTLQLKTFISAFLSDRAHDNQSANSMTAEVFRIALASLESRTVTVKLPDRRSSDFWPGDGFEFDSLGYEIALESALRAAGIQVIEGEE